MIELVTGVPSSGKSYFAAQKMLEIYKSKNRLIYTNVNLRIKYDDYIKALDVPDLYKFATDEYNLFQEFTKLSNEYKKKIEDEEISLLDDDSEDKSSDDDFSKYYGNYDKYLKDSGILQHYGGCYIFWDEAHNDLSANESISKADPIWIRFFSYHRHFDIDIFLITQDISLLHRKYKPFIAKYYFGQNPAKRFTTKTLKFKIYTDYRQFEKYYIETIQVPMKKEVFEFYDSGEYTPSKSVLLKKIAPALMLLISLSLFFWLYFEKRFGTHQNEEIKTTKKEAVNPAPDDNLTKDYDEDYKEDSQINFEGYHIILFACNLKTCTLQNSSFIVPLDNMSAFAEATNSKILYASSINKYYSLVTVSVPDGLYNDLMTYKLNLKGDKHSDNKIDFNSPISRQ